MKKYWKPLLTALLALGLLFLYNRYRLPMETILAWKPENLLLAAGVILLGYAVKSILIFVPLRALQILTGHLYSQEAAIAINLLGLLIVMTIPYLMGKHKGRAKAEALLKKHPRLQVVQKVQAENEMAFCFMLRSCAVPLGDIVTMYLSATGISYSANAIGGVLGLFPAMVLATILGAEVRNPQSPAFWQALGLNIAWGLLSVLGFYLYQKYSPRKEEV